MKKVIRVAIADMAVARAPTLLVTIGLGSCVGITLYDPVVRVGGMAHILLPYQNKSRAQDNPAKFVDSALPVLIEKMIAQGAVLKRLQAKLAGGAQMFASKGSVSEIFQVGRRNVEAARAVLQAAGIKLVAEDTGGNHGRTLEFDTTTGLLRIKTIAHGEKLL